MTTIDQTRATNASALRKLYFARFGFAVVWAAAFAAAASTLNALSIALLVLYPVVDLAAAVIDRQSSRGTKAPPVLWVNMALSLLAAIGLAIAAASGTSAALIVWGAWAITAGLVQLTVATTRRALGGQWPMILSGGISALAGIAFIVMGTAPEPSITGLAGYAVLGGIFFLISALRLGRAARKADR
jgi:uncharacterized membrane protein HdeD (DUF308 family)